MKQFLKILLGVVLFISITIASELSPTQSEVAKIYVATFNRAPDSAGLAYWTNDSGLKLSQIAQSFFDQPETQTLYPQSTTNRDFIKSVYKNLFNRVPDTAGWDYWENELNTNRYTKNLFIQTVINGAKDSADGMDKTILENKTLVSVAYVDKLGAKTNIADENNKENDPAYKASIKILVNTSKDSSMVIITTAYLDSISGGLNPIQKILDEWDGSTLVGENITITSKGGDYQINGLTLTIPANTLSSDKLLIVSKEAGSGGFEKYKIYGLRSTISKPIEIVLPIPTGIDSSKLVMNYRIKNGCYSKTLGSMLDCNNLIKGEVTNNHYIATIPAASAIEPLALQLDSSSSPVNNTNGIYTRWMQSPDVTEATLELAPSSFEYNSGHFLIYSPNTLYNDKIINEIAPGLEYAYRILESKFNLSVLPDPMKVNLKAPSIFNGLSGTLGMAVNVPLFGSYIDINIDELGNIDKKTLFATLGHEFFHTVQREYVPNFYSNDFVTEMASVWLENKVDDDTIWKDDSYTAFVAVTNRNFPPYGLSNLMIGKSSVFSVPNYTITTKTHLGYGASIFLDYITDCTSTSVVKDIFENLKNGQDNIDSIDNALRKSDFYCFSEGRTLKDVWNAFLSRDYFATDSVIKDSYLADYSYTIRTATDAINFERIFEMGAYSGVGILFTGKSMDADSPDYTSLVVNFKGDNVVGNFNYLDGTTYTSFPRKSGNFFVIEIHRDNWNKEAVLILSNPTKSFSEVDLTIDILNGSDCPAPDLYGTSDGPLYIKKSDKSYIACAYHSGKLSSSTNYVKNKKDGIRTFYDESGQVWIETSYSNGLHNGPEKRYTNGKLTMCRVWENGVYVKSCMPPVI